MRPKDQPNPAPMMSEKKRPFQSKSRLFGLFLIGLAVLIAWFLIVGFAGWRSGETIRDARISEAMSEQVARQKELAQTNFSEGNYQLALLRLNWVIEQTPNDAEALSLKQNVENSMLILFTPTPTPEATLRPTQTPLPTPTPGLISSPSDELQRIRRLMATKDWETAVSAITKFQREFPSYERQETDTFLYDAYLELALDMINSEDVERGMYYLAQAHQLGDLSQDMLDYETWAELYLQGLSFYGANWDAASYYFRDLCLAAPFYQNSCSRLQEVLVNFGDQQGVAQEWCPAQELYREAAQYDFVPGLDDKLSQAQEMCLAATPTPEAPTIDELDELTPTPGVIDSFVFSTPTPTPVP